MKSAAAALQQFPSAVVVDDSKIGRFFAKNALEQAGFRVVAEGVSGTEAVRLYETFQPTFLLLDIVLPEMDGLSAARAILMRHPNAKLVMCSAFPAREQVLASRDLGVAHFLIKPIAAAKLVELATMLVGNGE